MSTKQKTVLSGIGEWWQQPLSGFGAIRVVAWAASVVAIAHAFSPAIPPTFDQPDLSIAQARDITLMVPNSGLRVREDVGSFKQSADGSIAWIGGSSLQLKDIKSLLPSMTMTALRGKQDLNPSAYLYLLPASRTLDTMTMMLDAYEREPDVLVVALNPFWVLNAQSAFYLEDVTKAGASLWWNRQDWPLQFLMTSPSDHLGRLLRGRIPTVLDPESMRLWIEGLKSRWNDGPLKAKVQNASEPKDDPIAFGYPLMFWTYFRGDKDPGIPQGRVLSAWQRAAMRSADVSAGSWTRDLVERMAAEARSQSATTIFYMAPANPELKTYPNALRAYRAVRKALGEIAQQYQSEHVRFLLDYDPADLEGMTYRDLLHLVRPGKFTGYLARQISEALKQ